MKINDNCKEISNNKILKLNENKSTLYVDNAKGIVKIKVDGCAINDNNILKCDYLLHILDESDNKKVIKEIFIELKGKNIPHAIEQIKNTIEILSTDKKKCPKLSFVIATKVKPSFTSIIQKNKIFFKKNYNSSLNIETKEHRIAV
ncbi:hypothetical protein E0494_04515 [Marinilabiliaceae bacterium JC040]|nr:hypothetical protein [Marinilabiliaceae bacterium JC040]